MGFLSEFFGGPSKTEKNLQNQSAQEAQNFSNAYNELMGEQQGTINELNNIYSPIAEAGPTQQGYGPQELAALNTAATEGNAENYAKASQALNNQLSTRGGGSEELPTGGEAALKETLAANAATTQSKLNTQNIIGDYNTGRQNWQEATAGLHGLAGLESPNTAGSLAIEGGGQAFQEAKTVNAQQQQEVGNMVGLGASLIAAPFTGGASLASVPGVSSGSVDVGNPLSGGGQDPFSVASNSANNPFGGSGDGIDPSQTEI